MTEQSNTNAANEITDQSEYMQQLKTAPITEFAAYAGIELDEAVNRRVAAAIVDAAIPPKMDISVRPIEPQGNLYGFASVIVGGIKIDDFKIVRNKDGELFVGMPSKPDKTSTTGYRNTVFVDKDFKDDFNAALIGKYQAAIRAHDFSDKPRIADQVTKAKKEADKHNADLPLKEKGGKKRTDRD
jgi:DNA-binding cell septation regulator SpoVG